MPLAQRRKRTDLFEMFNKILYIISIKASKTAINLCPFSKGFCLFTQGGLEQVSLTVKNNKIALLTTPTISKLFVDCKM